MNSFYLDLETIVPCPCHDDTIFPVPLPEPRGLGRGARVYLAHELSGFVLLGVEVEPVTVEVRHLADVAEAGRGRGGAGHGVTGHGLESCEGSFPHYLLSSALRSPHSSALLSAGLRTASAGPQLT